MAPPLTPTLSPCCGQRGEIDSGSFTGATRRPYAVASLAPWHFLYFLPEPHGQGSLRPIFG